MRCVQSFNHIALPTNDSAATADFYTRIMGFRMVSAVREERVPSTGAETPFLHTLFALEDGGCMAFFEVVGEEYAGRSDGVPSWIRHFAMNVDSYEQVVAWKEWLEENDIEVLGIVDHEGLWESIYFFDPNGLRLEITYQTRELTREDAEMAERLLAHWIAERKAESAVTAS